MRGEIESTRNGKTTRWRRGKKWETTERERERERERIYRIEEGSI